jgi:outer membrane protein assembly factor BamA
MKKFYGFLLIVVMLFCCSHLWAEKYPTANRKQDGERTKTQETKAKEKKKCKNRIIAAPIMFYTPETKLAFGGAGSYVFRMGGCKDEAQDTRPSSISPVTIYTVNKQFSVQLKADLYFKNNDYRMETAIKLQKYPDKFYGVGSDTLQDAEENFTSRSTNIYLSFLKKIGKGLYVGMKYRFNHWKITEAEPEGQLIDGAITGSVDGRISGITFLANRDSRDNIFFPMRGDFFQLNAGIYKKFLGSDFDFTDFTLDLRKYMTLFSSHVFAVQFLARAQTGSVPFMELAMMGGEYNMRGYYAGRFRDKNLLVLQAEYRLPLVWRLGLVGFAGLGNVAGKFSQLNLDSLKPSYGVGLRFLFDKKEKIYLRMDIGFGKGTSGFYFSIFEAF